MTADAPTFGELVTLRTDNWKELPDPAHPFYVLASDGLFVHRRTAQGRGLVRSDKLPGYIKPSGLNAGYFQFDGETLPASIYAQAVHFFRRIFEKHHTEAEVIITQHKDTKQYRLFVPTQRVAHGGVSSIYNPAHIDPNYLVIGTFHSHCDFGPGHSSTDEGDARDMDGLHGTIGYVNSDKPEMALMYALDGRFFHFQMPSDTVVDTTDLTAGTAPEWWDRYILMGTITDDMRQQIAPYATNDDWDRFMGRFKRKMKITPIQPNVQNNGVVIGHRPHQTPAWIDRWTDDDDEQMWWRYGVTWGPNGELVNPGYQMLRESEEFNNRKTSGKGSEDIYADNWEDALGAKYIDNLFDTNLIFDQDLEDAITDWPDSGTQQYWERKFRHKLLSAVQWFRSNGWTAKIELHDDRIKQIPGQTTVEEHMQGVIQ